MLQVQEDLENTTKDSTMSPEDGQLEVFGSTVRERRWTDQRAHSWSPQKMFN